MHKKPYFLIALVFIYLGMGCQNNTSTESGTSLEEDTAVASINGLVSSETDFVITPTKRPDMYVVCERFDNVKPETLKTLFIGAAASLNQVIVDSGRIVTGPIMAIYEKLPEAGIEQTIWVGIPINKPLKGNQYVHKNIKAGRFHKAKTMAGLGESAAYWESVAANVKNNGFKIAPPFIEYPSDTRTGEMTTVVTNSNLLIPEIKP